MAPYREPTNRGRELNPNLFFSNFSGSSGISQQNPGISRPKSLISLVFEGHTRTFWPPPLHVEDPHPTRKYLDSKVWVWVPFLCLKIMFAMTLAPPVPKDCCFTAEKASPRIHKNTPKQARLSKETLERQKQFQCSIGMRGNSQDPPTPAHSICSFFIVCVCTCVRVYV